MSEIKETFHTTARVEWEDPKSGEQFTVTIDGDEACVSIGDQRMLLMGTDQLGTLVHMMCRGLALVEEK